MDLKLLESLLWKSEGDALDFKKEQYPFNGTDDVAKGELIKDILAFANSWSTEDAYIVIGVEERPGHRGKVHGIANHLPEGNLQQLVNSKTNQPVRLGYHAVSLDGRQVGIIKVDAKQRRPFYLKKNFGKLKASVVYVRRGSSTAIANPDEVADMGRSSKLADVPIVELDLATSTGRRLGTSTALTSRSIVPIRWSRQAHDDDPLRKLAMSALAIRGSAKEWGEYRVSMARLNQLRLFVRNASGVPIDDFKVKITVPNHPSLLLFDDASRPEEPQGFAAPSYRGPLDLRVDSTPDGSEVVGFAGQILPQDEIILNESIYIGAWYPLALDLTAKLFARNISDPIEVPLRIEVDVVEEHIDEKELEALPNSQ